MSELHSIVVPMYNEEAVVREFISRTRNALEPLAAWELIAVDDGSRDATFEIMAEYAREDPRIKVVRLARNFGHQIAITAGMDLASGDTVTTIDADLQDPPEVVPEMVERWRAGADIVFGVRESRAGESRFKKATAAWFYRLMNAMSDVDAPLDAGDFRLMSRRAARALSAMREQNRYVRGMVGWIGMERAYVHYARDARYAGVTKYPLAKMVKLAANGITSFSSRPLYLSVWLGVTASGLAFAMALWAVVGRIIGRPVEPGWASLMFAVLFIGGVQLLTLGIVGEYIGRIYTESQRRPLYLLKDARGFDAEIAESPVPTRTEG